MPHPIQVKDPAFSEIVDVDAGVEKIISGFRSAAGPVFSRLRYLLFSDVTAGRIYKYSLQPGNPGPGSGTLTVFREHSNRAGGLTFDHQGRLLACENTARRVTRTEKNGEITVLADRYRSRRLNGPLDLVYSIDGSVYFTDSAPADAKAESSPAGVYQITPKGEVRLAANVPERPTGVALGPKQLQLYVADSSRGNIRAFDIAGDGSLSEGRILVESGRDQTGGPAGLKTDEAGSLYAAGAGGVKVFNAAGNHLGTIVTPEPSNNCCWGEGFRGLYVSAGKSIYHVRTKIPGSRTF